MGLETLCLLTRGSGKRMVFIAGQVGKDPSGKIVGENVQEQTKQAFEKMKQLLKEAEASMENIAKLTVYLTDIGALPNIF